MADKRRVGVERHTQAQYDALPQRSPDVLYFTTDTNRIYLGEKLFAEGGLIFTNTGSGWRMDRSDGFRFVHTDNDSIVDVDDHVLVVERDTMDEIVHNDFRVGNTWQTIFSNETDRMTYAPDSRLVVDTTGGSGRISVDLIVETDDPSTPLETHGIHHIAKDLGPGLHEFDMAKWDLDGKVWRVLVYSKSQWSAKQLIWRWGKMGGFSTVLGLDYSSDDNSLRLTGVDGYVLDEVHLRITHDDSLSGNGSAEDPLCVVNHAYMNGTLNVEKLNFSVVADGIGLTVVSGAPNGSKDSKSFVLHSKQVDFVKSDRGVEIVIPAETLKVRHDDTLTGDGTYDVPLKVSIPLVRDGDGTAIETLGGKFTFRDNRVDYTSDPIGHKKSGKTDDSVRIGNLDLTGQVDGTTMTFSDGVLSSTAFVYWDGEKQPMKFRRSITQVEYDQLVTDNKVHTDTIYYTIDTLRIYVGTALYTKDYTESGDVPIMYESQWVPVYPQWRPNAYYETNTIRMYDEKYWRCLESYMAKDDFIPKKWEEFEVPEPTVVRRVINEGPNDFQIAFLKQVPKYPLNDGWMTEHTFNFRIVADPDDPENARGLAQFLVDNEVITFKPGDYVRTDGTDQNVYGIKDFKGDARVITDPPTPESAINQKYFLQVLEGELDRLWAAKADQDELIRLDKTLKNKSDKWFANFDENDVGELVADDRVYAVRFPENPDIDDSSSIVLHDPDRDATYGLTSHSYREFVTVDGEEIEIFNDGTEVWAESFERDGIKFERDRRQVTFYTVLTVKSVDGNWRAAWGSKDIVAMVPGLPVVDCRYNYELILSLREYAEELRILIDQETDRAIAAEDELRTMIEKEIADREKAVEDLWDALREEIERAVSEESRIERESEERDRKLKDYMDAETARAESEEKRIEDESKQRDQRIKRELTDEILRVENESKDRDDAEIEARKEDVSRLVGKIKDLYAVKLDDAEFRKIGKVVTDAEWQEVEEYESADLVLKRTDVSDWSEDEVKLRIYNSDSTIVVEKTPEGVDIRQYNVPPVLPDRPIGTEPGRYVLKLTKDMAIPEFTWLPVTQDMYAVPGQDEYLPVSMRDGTFPRPDRDGRFALSYIRGIDGFEDGFYWMPIRDEDLNDDVGLPISMDDLDGRLTPVPHFPGDAFGKWALVVTVRGNKHMLMWEDIVDSLYITEVKKYPPQLPEFPGGEGDWVLAFSRHGTNETLYWANADRRLSHR